MARRKKSTSTTETAEPRRYVQSPVVPEPGIRCPHCAAAGHDHRVTHTYPNGNRRRLCASCGLPFISRREGAKKD